MLKEKIATWLDDRDVSLVGFSSARRWEEDGRVPAAFRPKELWPPTRTVITFGLQMPLPVIETTPSVQHRDLYNTCNRRLDDLAFDLARWLNRRGHASVPISRDGYANIGALISGTLRAPFSHTFAAWYAGLGSIGINNTILTPAFGPRVRFVSLLTAAELPEDTMMKESPCIRCGACSALCPVQALPVSKKALKDPDVAVADYDRLACARWARELTRYGCYPCGICIKVCPVGEDRILYGRQKAVGHYRKELEQRILGDEGDPLHRSWMHQRRHGSLLFNNDGDDPRTFEDVLNTLKTTSREDAT